MTSTSDYDFATTDFDHMTVDELYALTRNPDYPIGEYREDIPVHLQPVPTADLMKLAQVGRSLLMESVALAHEQDNAEFFEAAYELYGPLIDATLRELMLPYRNNDGSRI